MPLRPEGFLDVAKKIQASQPVPSGEGRYRTITARAYYAAYAATCEAMRQQYRYPPDCYIKHELLSNTLAECRTDTAVKVLGTHLNTLRNRRIEADYHLKKTHDEDPSDMSVDDAQAVLSILLTVVNRLPKVDFEKGQQ